MEEGPRAPERRAGRAQHPELGKNPQEPWASGVRRGSEPHCRCLCEDSAARSPRAGQFLFHQSPQGRGQVNTENFQLLGAKTSEGLRGGCVPFTPLPKVLSPRASSSAPAPQKGLHSTQNIRSKRVWRGKPRGSSPRRHFSGAEWQQPRLPGTSALLSSGRVGSRTNAFLPLFQQLQARPAFLLASPLSTRRREHAEGG